MEVDGVPVEFEDGKYTIAADNSMHNIVVTDNAGNETTYKVTVFKIYYVTFIVDGVEYLKVQVNHGSDAQLPEIPHKAGYDKTAPTWDHDGKSITEDTEINALYIKNPPEPQEEAKNTFAPEIKIIDISKLGLSQDEIAQGVTIRLDVEEISASSTDMTLIDNILEDAQKVGMYLDIQLLKKVGTGTETAISIPNQYVTISIVVPDELINEDESIERTYSIARVHNGKADILKANFDEKSNTLTFETDRFSTYAIVYSDTVVDAGVETGDSFNTGLYGLIMAASAILALAAVFFRRKTLAEK